MKNRILTAILLFMYVILCVIHEQTYRDSPFFYIVKMKYVNVHSKN